MPASARRQTFPPADPARYAPSAERPVRGKSRLMEHQMDIQPHQHDWGQLVFSLAGAVRVSAAGPHSDYSYIVPPSRAVWIPPGTVHAVTAIERAELRTLYLHETAAQALRTAQAEAGEARPDPWDGCRVLEVSPLLRELVQQIAADLEQALLAPQGLDAVREQHLAALIIDELRRARGLRLGLDLPRDKRLRKLCEAMLAAPQRHADLDGWAGEVGASARTLSRLFREELGTSYSQWRQQLLLNQALALAARKQPMNLIAAELGYASASAFSAMVTRAVGMPPSRFFERA
ncbi:helix-turn-helix transcriptional regulator [Paucibacter sp. APW11]|uniref:Helix-turn-helix transcriptional regulator n=1 Tax=Roseateles aquae TaxID=3077235 RepID=A0ABU3P9H3_9BURK|nr:helix-turn-helix transcriptional regulator [Paucibacter sp. APW11]MDT8999235.1 helix-turn-helix transcriptional regulator [Paucibacter sp. APW11]